MSNKYKFEFSDAGSDSNAIIGNNRNNSSSGCFVKTKTIVILAVVTAGLVLGVGIIVYFAGIKESTCQFDADTNRAFCVKWASEGDEQICGVCPEKPPTTSPTTTTTPTEAPPANYQLPSSVIPHHYNLEIKPDIYAGDIKLFKFEGSVWIDIEAVNETNEITLHMEQLDVTESKIKFGALTSGASAPKLEASHYEAVRNFYTIILDGNLVPGNHYYIEIPFSGPLKQEPVGFYYGFYKDGNKTVYLASTNLKATHARKVFPCFDEPALKAKFNITIVRKANGHRSLSNTDLIFEKIWNDGYTADVYATTPRMSTYLLAFIVCDYRYHENTTSTGVKYRTFAPPQDTAYAEDAQNFGVQIFEKFEEYFEPQYVLDKIDNMIIPDFTAESAEGLGLNTYGEELLQQPGMTSASDLSRMASVISHEIAVQWFGSLVTPVWWDAVWLSEGFASFWDYHVVGELHPEWKMLELEVADEMYLALYRDSLQTSQPLTPSVTTPRDIESLFHSVTQTKGSCVVRMMYLAMGHTDFISGLNRYLQNNKFSVVDTQNLWDALNEEIMAKNRNFSITELFDPWVTQMNYPVVMVTRPADHKITLTQNRFVMDDIAAKDDVNAPYGYRWSVPVTYTSSVKPEFNNSYVYENTDWMSYKDSSLTIDNSSLLPVWGEDSWVMVNIKQSGFYRVNYEESNWMAIIKQLDRNHWVIDSINRGQIINDAFNLAKAGLLKQSIALGTVKYMKNEMDYVPWRAFQTESDYISLMLYRTEIYSQFEKFLSGTADKVFNSLGTEITDNMAPVDVLTRTVVVSIACDNSHQGCVAIATHQFQQWMQDKSNNPMNSALRDTFYCTAVRAGNWDEWEFVYKMYHESTSNTELARLRRALTCSKQISLLQRVLYMSLNPGEVRRQHLTTTISYVAKNPWGRDLAWDFVTFQYDNISSQASVSELNNLISVLTESFNTEADYKKVENFVRSGVDLGGGESAFKTSLKNTQKNMMWIKLNFPVIKSWLSELGKEVLTYRLPTSVVPLHYDIEIKPNIYGSNPEEFNFEGTVTIEVDVVAVTRNITLLAWESLSIDVVSVLQRPGIDPRSVSRTSYDARNHFFVIHLDSDLQVGKKYVINARFSGPLKQDGIGLYLDYYKDGNKTVYLVATQLEPNTASKVFPCFDEPGYKSTFAISLVRQQNYTSLANTQITSSKQTSDGFVVDSFVTTPKMSVYLVALAVCDYKYLESNTSTGVLFRTYARPNAIEFAESAQEYGMKIFETLEYHFNPDYPITKLDSIALPSKLGAMENWGLVTYAEFLLYNPNSSLASNFVWMMTISAHELAHQWFGNVVTPRWWDWLWLSESFATYWQYFTVDEIHPEYHLQELYIGQEMYTGLAMDSVQTSHPMSTNVTTMSEMSFVFDQIAYARGSTVVRMMKLIMGNESFFRGLNRYLERRQYNSVEPQDLWDAFNEEINASGRKFNMTDLMDPWVGQMNYPVVMVTRPADHTIQLTQSRYVIGDTDKAPTEKGLYKYRWDIPITYTSSHDLNFSRVYNYESLNWMKKDGNPVTLENRTNIPANGGESWVIVNVQQAALFRVNYETENWNALIKQLETNHTDIHTINRGQIINDAWNLAKAGLLDQNIALSTVNYLEEEQDYLPWKAFLTELRYVDQMLERTDALGLLELFMIRLIDKPLRALGMDINNTMLPLDVYARVQLIETACRYGQRDCVTKATSLVNQWMMTNHTNQIDVNLRKTFYCTAVEKGGWAEWSFIFETYQQTTESRERDTLLSALTCTKQVSLINRILAMSLNELTRSDMYLIVKEFSNSRLASDLTWNFFTNRFTEISQKMGDLYTPYLIVAVTQKFNTQSYYQQIDSFIKSGVAKNYGPAFESAKSKTLMNMNWLEKNYKIYYDWLSGQPGMFA